MEKDLKKRNRVTQQKLEKAVELLEVLADEEQECSLSALAKRIGESRYKTMRLLESLQNKGVVQCAVESGRYNRSCAELLSRRLQKKAGRFRHARVMESFLRRSHETGCPSLVSEARPVLESLARQHNEAMYLTVLKGDEVLFVDMVDRQGEMKAEPLLGMCYPFFSNAAGKAMRSIDSWDLLEKIGKRWRRGQPGFPDLAIFKGELELIREQGVAVDCGGLGEGIVTVAVAVRDYAGKVVGAVAMLGPSFRMIGARLEQEIIPSLRVGGELLSTKFGYVRQ